MIFFAANRCAVGSASWGGCPLLLAWLAVPAAGQLPSVPEAPWEVALQPAGDELSGVAPGTSITQIAPTDFVADDFRRRFVTTLGGVIRLVSDRGVVATPYLNTTHDASFNDPGRHGLTTMALHPGFRNPDSPGYGKFYTLSDELEGSRPGGGWDFFESSPDSSFPKTPFDQALIEWTAAEPSAPTFSGERRELFRVRQPKDDHNMNDLAFGPDGYLYIVSGDGGNVRGHQMPPPGDPILSDNAQRLDVVFGKVLRIDPLAPELTAESLDPVSDNGAYRIPADNPLVGQEGAVEEIFSWGHRNPFRISLDAATGALFAGDVGQNRIESVDRVVKGGNYGWNLKEGGFLHDRTSQNVTPDVDGAFAAAGGLIDPMFQYDHDDGRSVAGGYVYRGEQLPQLFGKYVFGDFQGSGDARLFVGDLATGQMAELQIASQGADLPERIYSFGQDDANELYVLGGFEGVVLRIAPSQPTALGDFNGSGATDGGDFLWWQRSDGTPLGLDIWERGYGEIAAGALSVPEPSAFRLAMIGLLLALGRRA